MTSALVWLALALAAVAGAAYWKLIRPLRHPKPAPLGFEPSDDEMRRARVFMATHPIIDSHAHPGRGFLKNPTRLEPKVRLFRFLGGTFEERAIAEMREGAVDAAIFNGVADVQVIAPVGEELAATRDFEPGEAWASYQRQMETMIALIRSGRTRLCLTSADVLAAKRAGRIGAILAMEGADFLDNDPGRLRQVFDDGLRMITLVHYRDNCVGDIMTGHVGRRGLTDFGRDVVREMNNVGLMIDLAHASEKTALDALAISRKPTVITHTHINTPALAHPRFVSRELAQAVAETGGYIGAWPAGIGMTSLNEFADRIDFLVETVGEDHVAIGSDMDANYKPVLETYLKMPLLVAALMRRGHSERALAKIMGGNVLRVMDEVQGIAPGKGGRPPRADPGRA